jgi:hypothetical protein
MHTATNLKVSWVVEENPCRLVKLLLGEAGLPSDTVLHPYVAQALDLFSIILEMHFKLF